MASPLKSKTISGLVWSSIGKVTINGSNFLVGIILARLLDPKDFGLIGLIIILISISRIFVEGGFSKALIQNQVNTNNDYSTIFYANLGVALFLYAILFLTAPYIANFYEIPILKTITRANALGILFLAFTIVHRTQMSIKVDFKTQTKITFVAVVLSSIIGIYMAYNGFGVWSLVFKNVLQTFFAAILFWVINPWRPALYFSKNSFSKFTKYSSKIMLADALNIFYRDFILLVIGKVYGSTSLGYYTKAREFGDSSAVNLSQIIQLVSFPVLSQLTHDKMAFSKVASKFIRMSVFITYPISALLLIYAEEIIIILLTEKWIDSAILLKLLSVIGLLYPLIHINQNIINTLGKSKLYLIAEFIKVALVLTALIFTYKYTLTIMLVGQFFALFITFLVYTFFSYRMLKFGFIIQMKEIMPIIILTIFMGVLCFVSKQLIPNHFLQVFVGVVIATSSYLGLAIFFGYSEINEFRNLIKTKFK